MKLSETASFLEEKKVDALWPEVILTYFLGVERHGGWRRIKEKKSVLEIYY